MCMHKDRFVVFQLDPEIERTVRRLRKEQRNSKTIFGMNNLQDEGNLNPHGPLLLSVRKCIFIKEKIIILHFKSY